MSNVDPDFDPDDELDPDDHDNNNSAVRDLRRKLKRAETKAERAAELEAELFTYRSRDAFTAAELKLNDAQQRATLNELSDKTDLSPEALRTAATTLGFYTPPDPTAGEDADAQRAMAAAAAGSGSASVEGQLKPQEFAAWDMARRVDFMTRHPEKFAAIERGETVRV